MERPLRNENVYPRASGALVKIILERKVLADYSVGTCSAENPLFVRIPLAPARNETLR